MVEEGLFDRHPCDAVFALHNLPGFPAGHFAFRKGAFMAAADVAKIIIHGRGGHCAEPQKAIDPIVVGSAIVMALQVAVARRLPPEAGAVVTVSTFHAGTISNVIPETAVLEAAVRSFSESDRDTLEALVHQVCHEQAATFGARAEVLYERGYPSTINTPAETAFARRTAVACVGPRRVVDLANPFGLAEDFAYMLQKRPGCYFGLGIGDEPGRAPLHSPHYDFNDACLVGGATFWAKLALDYLG